MFIKVTKQNRLSPCLASQTPPLFQIGRRGGTVWSVELTFLSQLRNLAPIVGMKIRPHVNCEYCYYYICVNNNQQMIHDFTKNYFEDGAERSSSWLFTWIDPLSCLQTRFEKSLHSPQFMIVFNLPGTSFLNST